jgi:hypothetical protein
VTPKDQWPRCRDWIASALPYCGGLYEIEDIDKAIAEDRMFLLPGKHCAVVLEIVPYPNCKVLNVFAGGGETEQTVKEYSKWMDGFITQFARDADCKKVMHHCRPGGERVGRRLGYSKLWSVMVKEIS